MSCIYKFKHFTLSIHLQLHATSLPPLCIKNVSKCQSWHQRQPQTGGLFYCATIFTLSLANAARAETQIKSRPHCNIQRSVCRSDYSSVWLTPYKSTLCYRWSIVLMWTVPSDKRGNCNCLLFCVQRLPYCPKLFEWCSELSLRIPQI